MRYSPGGVDGNVCNRAHNVIVCVFVNCKHDHTRDCTYNACNVTDQRSAAADIHHHSIVDTIHTFQQFRSLFDRFQTFFRRLVAFRRRLPERSAALGVRHAAIPFAAITAGDAAQHTQRERHVAATAAAAADIRPIAAATGDDAIRLQLRRWHLSMMMLGSVVFLLRRNAEHNQSSKCISVSLLLLSTRHGFHKKTLARKAHTYTHTRNPHKARAVLARVRVRPSDSAGAS